MVIQTNPSLSNLNTFGLDVQAQSLVSITAPSDLSKVYHNEAYVGVKKMILGGGSNVLFTRNFLGMVLHMAIEGVEVTYDSEDQVLVSAGAGENWHQLVLWTLEQGYAGLENLSLIPGTVGAAPMQNIGAYGVELKEVFHSLEAYEIETGKLIRFFHEDCGFNYRYSHFKGPLKDQYVITRVVFSLSKKAEVNTGYGAIREVLEKKQISHPMPSDVSQAVIDIRRSKLPDPIDIGNAGSFFKNPILPRGHFERLSSKYPTIKSYPVNEEYVKIPAAWLIDQLGWKGLRRGDAGVHINQPLVLVNYGKATGKEILELSEDIQKSVEDTFSINLEREVNVY